MFRPLILLVSQVAPTAAFYRMAAETLYVRAEHASLPPHASDMLATRIQAIGGVGTCTPPDLQPCRLLRCLTTAISRSPLDKVRHERAVTLLVTK
jgi:hypothetical protein